MTKPVLIQRQMLVRVILDMLISAGDGKVDLSKDRKVLGSQIPKFNFSFNFGFDYKGFDFSAMLQGVAGVKGNA